MRTRFHQWLDPWRLRLSHEDALIPLSLLGLAVGLLSALLISVFHFLLTVGQIYILGLSVAGEYASLPLIWRFLLPVFGAILLGLVFRAIAPAYRSVGIGYTILRFHRYEARLPWQNAVVQFFGGLWALLIGLSNGREGPGVHMGATGGSLLGQWLHLPHNSTRTLVGCGAAAAIAASFNTPLAAVLFTLEVIVRQYTLASFVPVMLAASAGALLSTLLFGNNPAFAITLDHTLSGWEIPVLIGLGIGLGVAAAGFSSLSIHTLTRTRNWPVLWRFSLIGLLTGIIGLLLPQVMSLSYGTINVAAAAQLTMGFLLALTLAKLVLSALTFGCGLPLGVVGSTLVTGGFAGAAVGMGLLNVTQSAPSEVAFYTVLGMGAMMGAVLQAPLAALTAVIELTGSTSAIMPALLTIVIANLTSRQLFGESGIYDAALRANAESIDQFSLWRGANDVAIGGLLDRNIMELPTTGSLDDLRAALATQPNWLIIRRADNAAPSVVAAEAAAIWLNTAPPSPDDAPPPPPVDFGAVLPAVPARTADIGLTLSEARELMRAEKVDMLVGQRVTVPPFKRSFGVLTRQRLDDAT
ncbi:chloride channel protein [Halothiobacillus sp. DCM-1]|uniref:chloride channel protein n=1 Tax=Halothiobacillus sp. DCM-1 TaxID=3112558 RepID=UPI003249CA7D